MKELIARIDELYAKATPGPWCVESCGEKGDGCNVIGVAFGPDDVNAERPLSGWLEPYDSEGNEINYYRDEDIATLEHRDRNSGHNADLITALHNAWPQIRDALEAMSEDAERLNWLEQQAAQGRCPAIINDDNGHWAYSEDGMQQVPYGDDSQDIVTSFFVTAADWKPTLRAAIDEARKGER